MSDYKIIFTGPVGAGKTTAINAVSDIKTVSTDELLSNKHLELKTRTTVAMDFGVMKLNDSDNVHLYGTPGQERFDFMWDILTEGGIGLVLLIDNTKISCFEDLKFFLKTFSKFIEQTKVVVGITHMDKQAQPSINDYHNKIGLLLKDIPVFEIDARNNLDVSSLVEALLFSIEPRINA